MQHQDLAAMLKRSLDKAYDMMKAEGKVDLQLGGERTEPSWGHYTWRRLADGPCPLHVVDRRHKSSN